MTTSSQHLASVQRIRGLEMPWNRALDDSTPRASAAQALLPSPPQEFLAECVETIYETSDMQTFVFRRIDGAPLIFRAGQYLNIDFPVHASDQEPVNRSYSITSAPTAPWTFSITVKRDAKGLVSPWIHEKVQIGTVMDVLGPVGAFHLPDADRRARYLLLAAGAGITPIMSMVRTIRSLPGRSDVIMLYHGADPKSFAFRQELDYLAAIDSRMSIYYSLGNRESPDAWAWLTGRISTTMIEELAPDANGRQVYACGPEGYLQQAQACLKQLDVDASSIHVEYFSDDHQKQVEDSREIAPAGELAAQPPLAIERKPSPGAVGPQSNMLGEGASDAKAASDTSRAFNEMQSDTETTASLENSKIVGTGQFVMSFTRSGKNVRIDPGQKVLDAAQAAGIRIPMNCRQGMCGSCKSVKVQGEVDMQHQGGIRTREIEAGKFLPCCSTPCSDLIIDA